MTGRRSESKRNEEEKPPMNCMHCGEEILLGEEVTLVNNGQAMMHVNCEMREIIGSVAHLERRCSCFVPDSSEGDPPGMTRREAADLAVKLWRQQENSRAR
jgi:hypothetical protein